MESNSIEVKLKYQLQGHQGAIYTLEQGRVPNKILSAGADRKVIEWDLDSGEGVLIANSAATVMSLLYMKDRDLLLIGQTEGGVHLIDLKERKEIKYLKAHELYIFDILLIPDKGEMIFSCADGSLSIWSTKTYEMLYKRNFTMKKLRRMDLSPDGSIVAISRGDHAISLLSTADYSEINTIQGDSSFNVVRFSPDGKFILAGDKNAHLHRIRVADGAILESLPAHYWAIYDICYSPNEALFATASRDKIVKVWNANERKVLARLEGRKEGAHTHSVNAIFWQEQDRLISAGDDGDVRVWELKAD